MARIDTIFKKETKQMEQHPKRITKWVHYSKLHDNKDQYRERDREKVIALADLIEADGEVLQDLLIKKVGTDDYEIIAGHKRCAACKYLVEERGREEFSLLPCFIKDVSEVRAEFQLYSSNGYDEKTDYEIMHELERMKYLLENYPEEFPTVQKGRMVERLGKLLNMKKSTVGDYLTIAKNLGEKGMEKFRDGDLKKCAAVQMASLPEEEQEQLIDSGKLSLGEIKEYKQETIEEKEIAEEKETEPIQGQYKFSDVECNIEEEKEIPKEVVPNFGTFPKLPNMEAREAFVNNYRTWDVWCRNEYTEETFYRYDLPDGSAIVVKEFLYTDWQKKDHSGRKYYLCLPRHRHFKDSEANMTMLKEHLKNLNK